MLERELRVNQMEVEIDRDLSSIIARRQPTARDLRLLIAISKTIGNLERIGDEATRIARTVQRLDELGRLEPPAPAGGRHRLRRQRSRPRSCGRRSTRSPPAWTSMRALEVLKQDDEIDKEFDGLLRKLITYMNRTQKRQVR